MAFIKTTWVDRQLPKVTAAQLNRIEQGVDDLYNTLRADVGLGADLSVPNGSWTNMTWTVENENTGGMHSSSVNPTRLTIQRAGLYRVDVGALWANNITGTRAIRVLLNGATLVSQGAWGTSNNNAGDQMATPISREYRLAAGDYIEANVYQSSGAALTVYKANATYFAARFVAA